MFGFDDRTRALLEAVQRLGNVSAAAVSLGMDPSNAHRHLRAAERRMGARLVHSRRGGRGGRNARLAPAAKRMLRVDALRGVALPYDAAEGVTPIRVGRRVLFAAGPHPQGPVQVVVPPESIAIRRPGKGQEGSPRNVLPARVLDVRPSGEGTFVVRLAAGEMRLESLVVRGALAALRLRPGSRVVAIVKAVALRVLPERGSPPRRRWP